VGANGAIITRGGDVGAKTAPDPTSGKGADCEGITMVLVLLPQV
jgi:hypothetical protein